MLCKKEAERFYPDDALAKWPQKTLVKTIGK